MLASLVRHCIERRIAAVVVTLVFGCYGLYAYWQTPVEAFPDVTNLQVNVIAQSAGLAPPEVERQLTIPLERVLNGTPGMIGMRSESLFGLSLVYLTFADGTDSFRARTLVSERLASADLPDGVTPELAPDATPLGQVFQYHVVSDRHDLGELRAEQEWLVAPMLRRIPGVADVISRGGFLREVHVEIDPDRLHAHGLSIGDVSEAVANASRNVGGGFVSRGEQQLVVRGVGMFAEPADIGRAVLSSEAGTPVTVADVARLKLSHTPRQGAVGYNEQRDVVEGVVYMRRGENPSQVLTRVHETVERLNGGILPEGMWIRVFYDRSRLVGLTLHTVHINLLEGALLVIGMVWLFIRSLRGAMIVGVIIPLSLLTAFVGLYAIGLPANLISMGAIDFGIIVDGAVVMVENVIHKLRRHPTHNRREYFQLLVTSALEVARPTLYAMAIIIAALIPVFALESVEGRIFRPLALTYTFALLGALVFSLTVVPALCAIFMRNAASAASQDPQWIERLRLGYARVLERLLQRRVVPLVAALFLLASGGLSASRLGTEFLPDLDEGDILVFVEMPSSISLRAGQDILESVRRKVLEFPEVLAVETQQGRPEDGTDNESVNMAEMPVRLKPRAQWRRGWDKDSLAEAMRNSLSEIPGVRFNFSQPMKDNVEEAMSGVRGKVVLKIFGYDLAAMRDTLLAAVDEIAQVPGVIDLSLYRDRAVPQLEIRADRQALARAGVDVASVLDVVETALAGKVVSEIWKGERVVPVRVRVGGRDPDDLDAIGRILMPVEAGHVPMSELVEIATVPGRASINRESNSRAMALKFNVEGRDLGSVIREAVAAVEAGVTPPEGHYFVWTGEFENQARAMARLQIIVPISLLIILALLYGALGSGRSALAILLTAPFGLTGGLFSLWLTGIHLSVSAAIGFIALLGQVSLAGLLIVGAIEDRRREGMELLQAIVVGARERFRAVLLAALLAMFALLPMALSTGVGSETQKPFAVVLVGGMVTTLLVAMLVLPILYAFMAPATVRSLEGEEELA